MKQFHLLRLIDAQECTTKHYVTEDPKIIAWIKNKETVPSQAIIDGIKKDGEPMN